MGAFAPIFGMLGSTGASRPHGIAKKNGRAASVRLRSLLRDGRGCARFFCPERGNMKANWTTKRIALCGIVAAVYCIVTIVSAPIAYGPVQFRLSEALCVLPKKYIRT